MSLYDDLDTVKQKTEELAGWSSSTKFFQSHLQIKKAASTTKRETRVPKAVTVLPPVFDLNSGKKDDEDAGRNAKPPGRFEGGKSVVLSGDGGNVNKESNLYSAVNDDVDWSFSGEEYDPLWPNDYEKVVKDLREMREREKEKEDEERLKKREDRRGRDPRFEAGEDLPPKVTLQTMVPPDVESIEDLPPPGSGSSRAGAAIAPPPSLVEQVVPPKVYGSSVAAKIMAKYGFKEGQGLGKKEQGIAMALQVEKTSKRGGRIVHEKEMMPPPSMLPQGAPLSPPNSQRASSPPAAKPASITEMMKAPSKVVLLKNMVGPGEVDDELEPEVKDECNTKYGDVIRVIIYELPDVSPEEAVRIFVEFKRIESAIKAVVDLNGRFFGGRQVMAGFYPAEKLESLQLVD